MLAAALAAAGLLVASGCGGWASSHQVLTQLESGPVLTIASDCIGYCRALRGRTFRTISDAFAASPKSLGSLSSGVTLTPPCHAPLAAGHSPGTRHRSRISISRSDVAETCRVKPSPCG